MTSATIPLSSRAPRVLPQVGQKARLDPCDDRHVAGGPPGPVQVTRSPGNSAQARVSAPECRWHIRQEQVCGHPAGPAATNRMFPHRHPPAYVVTAIPCPPSCPRSALRCMRGEVPFKPASVEMAPGGPGKPLPCRLAERRVSAGQTSAGLEGCSRSMRPPGSGQRGMRHDCIFDLLTDLRSHALQNVLHDLAGQVEIALRTARRDVAAAHRAKAGLGDDDLPDDDIPPPRLRHQGSKAVPPRA